MIEIRKLEPAEVDAVGAVLPLHRLGDNPPDTTYLVAWDDGHAHVAWTETELGVPELEDVFVAPDRRNDGIGTRLTRVAEKLVAGGHDTCSISASIGNPGAHMLYERLGYRLADRPPKRVVGSFESRGQRIEVDDTIVFLIRAVRRTAGRSVAPER